MKKTLFLTAILSLSTSAWGTDCLMPQTIINVSEGATVTQNATNATENVTISVMDGLDGMLSASELMTQAAQTVTGNRPAVVKDGQGTLVIEENVGTVENPLLTTLVVREGTMKIDGATVTTKGSSNGNNLAVGGRNATLELTNGARYVYTDEKLTSSSVSIGGIDGDGTLILSGGSTLSTRQQVQAGSYSSLPIPTGANPYWEVGPHLGGTYTKVQVQGSADNSYYRVSTDAAGYSNQTITPNEAMVSTGHILVKEGSTLDVGTGFYVGNGTLTIDNATVKTATMDTTEDSFIGSHVDFGPASKSVVTIQNGGKWYAEKSKSIAISYRDGQRSEVTITGKGSLMQAGGVCYIGSNNMGQSDVRILDGGQMDFRTYVYARGSANSSHTILVDGGGSVFSSPDFYLHGATALTVSNGGRVTGTNLEGVRSDISVKVADGGLIQLLNTLTLENGATLDVRGEDSLVITPYAIVASGATVTVREGAAMAAYQTQLQNGATLINRGTLFAYGTYDSTTFLFGGSRLQTGEVLISGCGLVDANRNLQTKYDNGLTEGLWLSSAVAGGVTSDSGTMTLGALLTGKDEMQYLSSADMQSINEAVFKGLNVEGTETYTIAYKHEIGENITMNYTTDDLNNVTGKESIAVKGGAILVEQGEGVHHDGTIGSYENVATETQAAIAVHEHTSGSTVTWEGTGLHTVAGEKATLSKGNHVNVTPKEGLGTLTVVTASELLVAGGVNAGGITVENGAQLTNNGTLNAAVTVEGVLNGSGVITGSLTVNENGKLIVGNSPGYQNVTGNVKLAGGSNTVFCIAGTTAASEGHTGWTSGTASQICIANGALTLDANANVTIEFGGAAMINDGMFGLDQEFSVVLVKGGCDELAGQLTSLLAHTTFVLTSDSEGLTGLAVPESGVISVSGAQYKIEGSDLVLTGTMTYTPEPTTATLSLLALAGLAARRRRK